MSNKQVERVYFLARQHSPKSDTLSVYRFKAFKDGSVVVSRQYTQQGVSRWAHVSECPQEAKRLWNRLQDKGFQSIQLTSFVWCGVK